MAVALAVGEGGRVGVREGAEVGVGVAAGGRGVTVSARGWLVGEEAGGGAGEAGGCVLLPKLQARVIRLRIRQAIKTFFMP
jgi:hypothetical protein